MVSSILFPLKILVSTGFKRNFNNYIMTFRKTRSDSVARPIMSDSHSDDWGSNPHRSIFSTIYSSFFSPGASRQIDTHLQNQRLSPWPARFQISLFRVLPMFHSLSFCLTSKNSPGYMMLFSRLPFLPLWSIDGGVQMGIKQAHFILNG